MIKKNIHFVDLDLSYTSYNTFLFLNSLNNMKQSRTHSFFFILLSFIEKHDEEVDNIGNIIKMRNIIIDGKRALPIVAALE